MFEKGERVQTPMGSGSIVYSRMGGKNYSEVEAYSVFLDSKKAEMERPPFPSYNGTIFPASDVIKAEQ